MSRNLRGIYMGFEHDRPEDWRFLGLWQPSVVRFMPHGSHTDPASVATNRIQRIHQTTPESLILLRVWEVDDRNYDAHRAMYADPIAEARKQHAWWRGLFDRIPGVPRDKLMAGANNEPTPNSEAQAAALYVYTEELARLGTQDSIRYGLYAWSVGNPPKAGEAKNDWPYYARIEPALLAGNHAVLIHEYMQPEGMYGVWTDGNGVERHDWRNLMGRHLESGLSRVPVIIGEWGIEGLIFNRNRHPDPNFGGHNGWRSFTPLWGPERYGDEYVEYCRQCAPNVIGVCPFACDLPDKKWMSFDLQPAYGAFLARKHLCEVATQHTVHIPVIIAPPAPEPTALPPVVQPVAPNARRIDPRVMEAIMAVEAGRRTHGADGHAIIRFEAHIFRRELGNDELWARHFRTGNPAWTGQEWRPTADGEWRAIHTGRQADEYDVLDFAQRLNREAAYRSISVGAPQIMGFNHARVGYGSAQLMWQAFTDSAGAQMVAMCNFVLTDSGLHAAINARDWPEIGRRYNGAASAGELYRAAYVRLWSN